MLYLPKRIVRQPLVELGINRRRFLSGAAGVLILGLDRKSLAHHARGGSTGGGSGPGFYPAGHWVAATFPFTNTAGQVNTQIYPRPDTETAVWARHHWFYFDGVNAFNNIIPLISRGGAFPYVDQIMEAPAGTSLASYYWQSGWTIAEALAAGYGDLWVQPTGTFTDAMFWIRRYSQDGTYNDFEFTGSTIAGYNATAGEGFVFLDPVAGVDPESYPSSGTASNIASPIKTLNWAYGAAPADVTYPNAILVMRSGTVPTFSQTTAPAYGIQPQTGNSPQSVIAFPGETVSIDITNAGGTGGAAAGYVFGVTLNTSDLFFQGFGFTGTPTTPSSQFRYISAYESLLNRLTVHNISAPNVYSGTAPTDNASLIQCDSPGSEYRQYIAIKGCSESNRAPVGVDQNTFAITNQFNTQYCCTELCTATGLASWGPCYKGSNMDVTTRMCLIVFVSNLSFPINCPYCQWDGVASGNAEFCFNTLDWSSADAGFALTINGSYSADVPSETQAFSTCVSYRNSFLNCAIDVDAPATPITNGPFASINDAMQYSTINGDVGEQSGPLWINGTVTTIPANVTSSGTDCQAQSGVFVGSGNYSFTGTYATFAGLRGAIIG